MHVPVLLKETIEGLNPKPNFNYIDCTLGEGGHSLEILKKIIPSGKLLGIDFDQRNIDFSRNKFVENGIKEDNFTFANDNFKNLEKIAKEKKFEKIDGILFDLGLNTYFLEDSQRGFTFRNDEPLDMRFDASTELTASQIVNNFSQKEIQKILEEYGEETFAKSISENIILFRKTDKIETTFQLNEIIYKSTPHWYHKRKINPSTKTFMALRIYVNKEFENLKKALSGASSIVQKEGKIAVISFHSLEDKIVKAYFKELISTKEFRPHNKKVIAPKWSEVKQNKKSRSAKLRIIIKN